MWVVSTMHGAATITRIYKSGIALDVANYRPISPTSVTCKIMERVFKYIINNFFRIYPSTVLLAEHNTVYICKLNIKDFYGRTYESGLLTDIQTSHSWRGRLCCLRRLIWSWIWSYLSVTLSARKEQCKATKLKIWMGTNIVWYCRNLVSFGSPEAEERISPRLSGKHWRSILIGPRVSICHCMLSAYFGFASFSAVLVLLPLRMVSLMWWGCRSWPCRPQLWRPM